ncbi:MAG: hypothetical protein V1722_05975 [Candidatus Micrarchaeota archaeon]
MNEHKVELCDSDKTGGFAEFMEMVVTMDSFGRILLPKAVRKEVSATRFLVDVKNEQVILKPIPRFEDCIGRYKGIDMAAFRKQHEEDKGKDD